ncbi:MAG: hypothetical protein NTX48_00040, partial [Planctomycetales bacterium]|nr:hypothetical protein [Planctomycetales bacterium]
RLPLNQLTPYLLPFAHNSPHQKKPRDRNSPDPRLPTLARMVSPDAYKSTEPHHAAVVITTNSGLEWQYVTVPILAGHSAGIFSITEITPESPRLIVVGGDYLKPEQNTDNVAISDDTGRSWRLPKTSHPDGFRSAVVSMLHDDGNTLLITTGPSGTDQSTDGGESWSGVSHVGFHTMSFVSPATGWAAGSDGRVARWRPSRLSRSIIVP